MTTGARFLRAPHLEARAADERDQTGRLHCLGQLCLAAAQQPSFSSNAKWATGLDGRQQISIGSSRRARRQAGIDRR